ncbi:MAG: hypothetical protein HYS44_02180 [Candidatus Niyogibacteria bacterium]|nr:hypothetical protein [Candidatus Niyogibacteria bacterium]
MDEFELTYLPRSLPKGVFDSPSKELLDIYVPVSAEHPSLRIRRSGAKCEITKKVPAHEGDASHQTETTVPLTAEEYVDFEAILGKRVAKTRYYYAENGHGYEVDVFKDALKGLVLVDIEFASAEEKAAFRPPEWFLAEVTQQHFTAGGMLCGKRYADIEGELKKFGYTALA